MNVKIPLTICTGWIKIISRSLLGKAIKALSLLLPERTSDEEWDRMADEELTVSMYEKGLENG